MLDLVKTVFDSYRKTENMVHCYKHKNILVFCFKAEIDAEELQILAGLAMPDLMMDHCRKEAFWQVV